MGGNTVAFSPLYGTAGEKWPVAPKADMLIASCEYMKLIKVCG